MNLKIIGLSVLGIICVIMLFLIYGWRIVERHTFSELFVGQVVGVQKARIPGFVQYAFTYKKRGRTYPVNSRLVWHKTKLKIGGLYRIQVFRRKLPRTESVSWAIPVVSGKKI